MKKKKTKVAGKATKKTSPAKKSKKLTKAKLKKLTGGGLVLVPLYTPTFKPPVFHPPGFSGGPALYPGFRPSGPSGFSSSGANRASAGRGSSF